nr:MAK10-like protein [Tanacetum cinerariifolium]
MGDENPIRTLGDYSKPSHEDYGNTIKLLVENNVVPLQSNTIRLVQNGYSFHRIRFEDPNQHLKDFLKIMDSLDLDKFSLEVARILKESIKENENKPRKIKKITKYPDTKVLENSAKHNFLENLKKNMFPTSANLLYVRYFRLIPLNPSQPRKNTFGFKPRKRANQSQHNPSNSLTVRSPTQSDPTFMDNDPIKRDSSPHCSFTHVESNHVFDSGGKTHDVSLEKLNKNVVGLKNVDNLPVNLSLVIVIG